MNIRNYLKSVLPKQAVLILINVFFLATSSVCLAQNSSNAVSPDKPQEISTKPQQKNLKESKKSFQAFVKVSSARVREKPSFKAEVAFGLEKGSIVSIIDTKEEWYQIKLEDGKIGWAHRMLFSKNIKKAKIKLLRQSIGKKQAATKQPKQAVEKKVDKKQAAIKQPKQAVEKKVDKKQAAIKQPKQIIEKKIEEIRVEGTSKGIEKVIFKLNGFYPPKTFALGKEKIPKIVCDFFDTDLVEGIDAVIPVGGKLIKQIRTGHHKTPRKIRVVIDLLQNQQYGVEQIFFKNKNIYTLTFKPVQK